MTYILAATEQTALKLAQAIISGKLPPMADDLDKALCLRGLHPQPLRYGLGVYLAKTDPSAVGGVSAALVRPSELARLGESLHQARTLGQRA